jgi:hypothetical protein
MDNSEIKRLIIHTSSQACGLITLWGITNYFDKAYDPEIITGSFNFLGIKIALSTKIFYKMSFLTSLVLCTSNILKRT